MDSASKALYLSLYPDGRCCHCAFEEWPLPLVDATERWRPGDWIRFRQRRLCIAPLGVPLHELRLWLGPSIFAVERAGRMLGFGAPRVRLLDRFELWDRSTMVLYATDCADHVRPLFEDLFPSNSEAQSAINAARAVALGEMTLDAMEPVRKAASDMADVIRSQVNVEATEPARRALMAASLAIRAAASACTCAYELHSRKLQRRPRIRLLPPGT